LLELIDESLVVGAGDVGEVNQVRLEAEEGVAVGSVGVQKGVEGALHLLVQQLAGFFEDGLLVLE